MSSGDLSAAIEAARGAGRLLEAAFGSRVAVEYKSLDQPVTQADRDADSYLRGALLAHAPGYGWISEESLPANAAAESAWVVDPLDGTVNFVEGRPEFAVCIGLIRRGAPVLGVVYNPITDQLYAAERGGVATLNGASIAASEWQHPARLVVSWGEVARFSSAEMSHWRVSTVGSTALKLMEVARGAADAYVSQSPKKIWDLCAPALIAEVAGATVLDGVGRPLSYISEDVEVRGTIAYGRGGGRHLAEMLSLGAA